MKAKLNYKAAFLIILVILINAAVIIATSLLWKYFNSEEKRAEKFLLGRGLSTDELGGRKFVPASEFLKGYDD